MSYWKKYTQQRVGRRKVLVAGSALTASALFLAACGGDDDDDSSSSGGSSSSSSGGSGSGGGSGGGGATSTDLVYKPQDTTSSAKIGGNLSESGTELTGEGGFDLAAARSAPEAAPGRIAYPGLLKFATGKYPDAAQGDVEGDIAESFEYSADRTEFTMKLRQGLKWDSREPTSGREIDAQDVLATWEKFSQLSAFGGAFAYSEKTPNAPIESLSAPDSHTIVFKLHQPNAALVTLFAIGNSLPVMPREATNGGYDPVKDVRGYGPYFLETYEPSVRWVWRRNPDYHVKGFPYIETVEQTILPEYSSRLAQFRAGSIYTNVIERVEDILPTKKDLPDLLLTQDLAFDLSSHAHITFGYEGDDGEPFRDQRVRQAVSMLIDRNEYVDLMTQRDAFAAEGIDVRFRMPSPLPAGFEGYWLDPTDESAYGPTAKYVSFNPDEAKKLLAAANYPDGFTTPLLLSAAHAEIYPYADLTAIVQQHLKRGGINAEPQQLDYRNDFLPNVYGGYSGGNTKGFSGMATRRIAPASFAGQHMFDVMHPAGRAFAGAPVNGGLAADGDPEVTALIESYFLEFDMNKQEEIAKNYQRMLAEKANLIQTQIYTASWALTWPVLGNYGYFVNYGEVDSPPGKPWVENRLHWWIDESKPPLA